MKIAIITNLYGRYARGGAESVVKAEANALVSAGHRVFIISGAPFSGLRSLYPMEHVDGGIKVFRYYPLNFFSYYNSARHGWSARLVWTVFDVFNLHSYWLTYRLLRKEKPELVLTHNLKGLGYLIPLAVKKLRLKNILTLHDVQLVNPSGLIIKGREKDWLNTSWPAGTYAAICRSLFAAVDEVISPSQWLLTFYKERGFFREAKCRVLPNPGATLAASIPVRLGPRTGLKLLFVGQVEEHKGISWLCQELQKMDFWLTAQAAGRAGGSGAAIPVSLTVVGDGAGLAGLRSKYHPVSWLGRLYREQVFQQMAAADFLIFPSMCYENSPTVIYEAFGRGLPVIAANIGGVAELINHGSNGFLFAPADGPDLIRALSAAATLDGAERASLSQAALNSVADFTAEKYIRKLLPGI